MDILKKIQEYFLLYEQLDAKGRIYANMTPLKAVNYSINEIPSQNGGTIQQFGMDTVKQFQWSFDTKVIHSTHADNTNFNNAKFYGDLQNWIEHNNFNKVLPDIEGIMSIEVTQTAYLKAVDPNGQYAIHSMSGRITYYKEEKYTWQ